MHELIPYIKGEVLDLNISEFTEVYGALEDVSSVLAITDQEVIVESINDKIKTARFKLPDELGVSEQSAKFDTIVSDVFWEAPMLDKVKLLLNPDGLFVGSSIVELGTVTSKLHDHFSDVETWEADGLTLWKAKI